MNPKLLAKIIIIAWLHKNDWVAGVQSVNQHIDQIQEVSPAWFVPTRDGGIVPLDGVPVDDPALVSLVHSHNVPLRPILMNAPGSKFDPNLVRTIFSDRNIRANHIAAIVQLVETRDYNGIDIDYEGLAAADLPQLADFIGALGDALHAEGKTLAIDLQAKFAGQNSSALRRIGVAADSIRLMAYPEHNASTPPGPIASLGWIRDRLSTAKKDIPIEKLALGMATYAMSWNPSGSGSWSAIAAPVIKNGKIAIFRDRDGVPSFQNNGQTIYFEDAQSISQKMNAAESFNVNQFALWRLGSEDPEIWDLIKSLEQQKR